MGKTFRQLLEPLYREHGLMAFVLFFIPLIPGFIESHTIVYLKLVDRLAGDAGAIDPEAIKLLFGQRGQKEFNRFTLKKTPRLIPIARRQIADQFFLYNQPHTAIELINQLFFDYRQRQFPESDRVRMEVIHLLPQIFKQYSKPKDQLIRSTLIKKCAMLAVIEQAINPRRALVQVFSGLLYLTSSTEKQWRQHRLNSQLNSLEARIKAELTGKATAGDPDFCEIFTTPPPDTHLLTQSDVTLVTQSLNRLKNTNTLEIYQQASVALKQIDPQTLTLSN